MRTKKKNAQQIDYKRAENIRSALVNSARFLCGEEKAVEVATRWSDAKCEEHMRLMSRLVAFGISPTDEEIERMNQL